MRVVALISGGKDSCYNMMKCVSAGHEIVALANLQPSTTGELDSFMFQTVGHEGVHLYAQAMGLPLYQATTNGVSVTKEMTYHPSEGDEVEDLYQLLLQVKQEVEGGVEGVASGAILSDYQRLRVESVCVRLGLVSLAYLWRRDQEELLGEMVEAGLHAILIKVAAMGLHPDKHLGRSIKDMQSELCSLNHRYGINVCGEGGEYETFTLDCPLFKKKIIVTSCERVVHSDDAFAPVAYLRLSALTLQDKDTREETQDQKSSLQTVHLEEETTVSSHQQQIISPVPHFTRNSFSWTRWYGDPSKVSVQDQTGDVFARFGSRLRECGCGWHDVVFAYLVLADMTCYREVNSIYLTFFPNNPPGRVCVAMALPQGVHLYLDAVVVPLASHKEMEAKEMAVIERRSMHVQSISEWAPANIGPYSQAYVVGPVVFLAGQIGLDPATMTLVPGSLAQARLSLLHMHSVLKANQSSLTAALCGTCYYTADECGQSARQAILQNTVLPDCCGACPVVFVHVSSLPRAADVEWHFISLRQPYCPSYRQSTEYVESVGLLSAQEAWCEQLQVGAWLVEACLPYYHHGSGLVDMRTQIQVCLDRLQEALLRCNVTLSELTCVNFYLPKQDVGHHAVSDLQAVVTEKFLVDPASVTITTTSEPWAGNRRVTIQAVKLSLPT